MLTLRRNHLPPAAGSCIRDLLVGNNTLRRLDLRHNTLRVRSSITGQHVHHSVY